jgi:hypothetical protein
MLCSLYFLLTEDGRCEKYFAKSTPRLCFPIEDLIILYRFVLVSCGEIHHMHFGNIQKPLMLLLHQLDQLKCHEHLIDHKILMIPIDLKETLPEFSIRFFSPLVFP